MKQESILLNGIIRQRTVDVTTVFITRPGTMLDRGLKTMHQCVIGFGFASTGLSVTWHSTKFHSSFAQPFFGRVICWIPAFAGMTAYLNRIGVNEINTKFNVYFVYPGERI